MSTRLGAGQARSRYESSEVQRGQDSVRLICRGLSVAPGGYYEWVNRPLSNRAREDARLLRLISKSFTASQRG
jgi:putative transposase